MVSRTRVIRYSLGLLNPGVEVSVVNDQAELSVRKRLILHEKTGEEAGGAEEMEP